MSLKKWLQGPMFKIYIAHTLSSWGDRMWWFAGGLFMKDLEGSEYDNLKLTGIFTFALSGSVVAFGASVGRWVDNTPRLKAVQLSLIAQNASLVVCVGIVCIMFIYWEGIIGKWKGWLLIILQSLTVLTAALSRIASIGTTIIMQKDWIIILANEDLDHLATINTVFRAIDLGTQVLAPVFIGVLQDQISKLFSAITIGVWNIFSMIVEYSLFWAIYRSNPRLSAKENPTVHSTHCTAKYADHGICPEGSLARFGWIQYRYRAYCYDWRSYFKHSIRMMGIGLALLYMTVLGFDAITTAYGSTQTTTSLIGAAQGAGALVGMLGSASFPVLRKCIKQETIGICGMILEVLALVGCVISIWLPGSPFAESSLYPSWTPPSLGNKTSKETPNDETHDVEDHTSVTVLFAGIVASRFGLWLSDITITQLMQENIEEHKRGVINGVQDAINMGMDMLKSLLVIIFPYPQQFGLLILLSFISVCLGLLSYTIYFCNALNSGLEEVIELKLSGNVTQTSARSSSTSNKVT